MSQHTPVESALKMGLIFSDFENYSKSAPGKISLSIVLVLYTYEIGKTVKKPRVMSFLPWIGCQTVVQRRFADVHANFVSMPNSNGNNHLLTIID